MMSKKKFMLRLGIISSLIVTWLGIMYGYYYVDATIWLLIPRNTLSVAFGTIAVQFVILMLLAIAYRKKKDHALYHMTRNDTISNEMETLRRQNYNLQEKLIKKKLRNGRKRK